MSDIQGENRKKRFGGIFWMKGLVILLIVMFVFTVISRAADSFTVAKVSVMNVSARKIQHTVSAEGLIEENGEFAVITLPDILVRSIEVHQGEAVQKGDVLAQLDMDSLCEQMESVQNEIKVLELQNQALKSSEAQTASRRSADIQRAKEDYEETVQKNAANVSAAQQELQAAKDELARAEQELQSAKDELAQAEQGLRAEQELQSAKDEPTGAEQEPQSAENETKETGQEDENYVLQELREKAAQKQTDYDNCQSAVNEKEAALSAAVDTQQAEEKAARRVMEDADMPQTADNSMEINNITMENIKDKLEKLQDLEKQEGQICAPESGIVTRLDISVGQKTTDTAAVTMSDTNAGLRFVAQITKEDGQYVAAGDTVTLQSVGKTLEDCEIISVEADETGEMLTVTAFLEAGTFNIGERVSMNAVRESQEYSCTIPTTALRQENNKMFLLLLDTEDTILGRQYVARKVEVNVLDKNTGYAAVDSSSLNSDSQIIIDTDRYVEAGARVRLMDE